MRLKTNSAGKVIYLAEPSRPWGNFAIEVHKDGEFRKYLEHSKAPKDTERVFAAFTNGRSRTVGRSRFSLRSKESRSMIAEAMLAEMGARPQEFPELIDQVNEILAKPTGHERWQIDLSEVAGQLSSGLTPPIPSPRELGKAAPPDSSPTL